MNRFRYWIIVFSLALLGLGYGCGDEPGLITESTLSYLPPELSSVQIKGFDPGVMTLEWVTNKPCRGFLQISEDGKFGPSSSTTEKKCLVIENTFRDASSYSGNDYSSEIKVDQVLQRGSLQTVTTLQCATAEVSGTFYSTLNVESLGLFRRTVLPTRVLDISYIHVVDKLETGALLGELFVKVSLDKGNFDPARLSVEMKKVYESQSSWTMGNSSYSSPYVQNPANFDLKPFLDAGMKVQGEVIFSSHSSLGALTTDHHKCTVRGLNAGKEYYIRVVAMDSWGNSTVGSIRLIKSLSRSESYSAVVSQAGGSVGIPNGPIAAVASGQMQWSDTMRIGYLDGFPEKTDSPVLFGKGCFVILPTGVSSADLKIPKGDFTEANQIYSWSFGKGYQPLNTTESNQILSASIDGQGYFFLGKAL
ncbi:MAG: hypothetical protein CVV64_08330 [Candidatus Wallbacteria bacterium HGW-Wallbacteria-1]|jgi:hypothetical protein|uniref:Fibronectin type-III domain-containing protein n=1 Tax=Candidatus Wallbacteria bacterium HGW-Wallbacteria-1 TaxID=2013854 RepID=A0A2N1PRC5_9BACT|nr:MAG: hypothetical protein CVV64_08330 [Candidatus Wallbacteria bacterium HGW-Wallbacteria-1]